MLYDDRIDTSKNIYPTTCNREVKNAWFTAIGFLTMKSNFKVLYASILYGCHDLTLSVNISSRFFYLFSSFSYFGIYKYGW